MNYGYAVLDASSISDDLLEADKPFVYHIQLYDHLFSQLDLHGKDVVEIGSGRGGGGYFANRYRGCRSYVGVDLSPLNVRLSRERFSGAGVEFRVGDAQRVPLPNAAFDVAVNVESSHNYPSPEAFFGEVTRVLRPDGWFLCTDFRRAALWPGVETQLTQAGLIVEKSEDITENVLASLRRDDERKLVMFRQIAQNEGHYRELVEWGACIGSAMYQRFEAMETTYRFYVCRKAPPVSPAPGERVRR